MGLEKLNIYRDDKQFVSNHLLICEYRTTSQKITYFQNKSLNYSFQIFFEKLGSGNMNVYAYGMPMVWSCPPMVSDVFFGSFSMPTFLSRFLSDLPENLPQHLHLLICFVNEFPGLC